MLRKILYGFIFCLLSSTNLIGQININSEIERYSGDLSPSQTRYNKYSFYIENNNTNLLLENPAYLFLLRKRELEQNNNLDTIQGKTIVIGGYDSGKLDGDFLFYEGNKYKDYFSTAGGEISIKDLGMLYGMGRYARGKHSGYTWNTIRHFDLYAPYTYSDSLGGIFDYEDYSIMGGYSFKIKNLYMGVEGSYRGELGYRKKAIPSSQNYTTWLNLKFGAAYLLNNKHLFSAYISYLYNKQYVDVMNWFVSVEYRYYIPMGFGIIDLQNSPIARTTQRMYYLKGVETSLGYNYICSSPFFFNSHLNYQFRRMNTEERSIKQLFISQTHNILPFFNLGWDYKDYKIEVALSGKTTIRHGLENIYDNFIPDTKKPLISDFKLNTTRSRYRYFHSDNNLLFKYSRNLNIKNKIEFLAGTAGEIRTELYKESPEYHISNVIITPQLGFGYERINTNSQWNANATFFHRKSIKNTYDLIPVGKMLDFQHAFMPYAFHSRNGNGVKAELSYVHNIFKSSKIGINLQVMYMKSNRAEEVIYPYVPSIISPRVDENKANHIYSIPVDKMANSEIYTNIRLFLLF